MERKRFASRYITQSGINSAAAGWVVSPNYVQEIVLQPEWIRSHE